MEDIHNVWVGVMCARSSAKGREFKWGSGIQENQKRTCKVGIDALFFNKMAGPKRDGFWCFSLELSRTNFIKKNEI